MARALRIAARVAELMVQATAPVVSSHAQGRALRETAHRPWPLPGDPWLMAHTWEDLLFQTEAALAIAREIGRLE